ncbi:histidine--tRNA ligase [Candidatus Marsarchaeota archaeon]|nr:histidine--tRNA ligase [Candidatus Marsarchaeota archaeon]
MSIKSPQGTIVDIPRGTSDYGTADAIMIHEIISVVVEVFRRFGFSPIITPAIENTAVLNAKAYGEESTKEIYLLDGKDSALRFDLTVPLARFMAMNKDLKLPFKRYQVGRVWRKDEPQFMRSRELFQADIDIVGSADISSDAECIAATLSSLEALGITDYTLLINSRTVLDLIMNHYRIAPDKHGLAMRIIDKMSKVSMSEAISQLVAAGLNENSVQQLVSFITEKSDNGSKLNKLEMNINDAKQEADMIKGLLDRLERYGVKSRVEVDFSLARGLDYYTGFIWEIIVKDEKGDRLPSIGSGGRYDKLMGMYSKSEIPSVGSSIGITRVSAILKNKSERKTYANVHVIRVGDDVDDYAIDVSGALRRSGLYVDLNVTKKGISKQLEHAHALGIRYSIILGRQEADAKKIRLKDMQTGTEELLDISDAIARIKG